MTKRTAQPTERYSPMQYAVRALPALPAFGAFAAGALIIYNGTEAALRFGQPGTYFAISAGLAGTILAIAGYQHNQRQYAHSQSQLEISQTSLAQSISIAQSAELDRQIEREIGIRRTAVIEVANYLVAINGAKGHIRTVLEMLSEYSECELNINIQIEVRTRRGEVEAVPILESLMNYMEDTVTPAELRAIGATFGSDLSECVDNASIHSRTLYNEAWRLHSAARHGMLDEFNDSNGRFEAASVALDCLTGDVFRDAIVKNGTVDQEAIKMAIKTRANQP
ncbi:hypothetical protein [Tsukamurella tyrosinosolvens]|uniref:hypothetical protein n=1 Tax=Tsukamurella tyrosinosolvens TaxID=57704 RepID=UPI002DD4383D|nr:hypothetical protein [Tsukamurella tyrosinosolvens]MEC4614577.1 hypothetical protein [Tsukamurella tyrosinosolvens]